MKNYPALEWTAERIAKFWDWQSSRPEDYFTFLYGDSIIEHLSPYLRGRKTVLDYGCGTGSIMPHLLDRGHHVYGLDFSTDSIAGVNARFRDRAGFHGAYLPDELARQGITFDAILLIEVVEHLTDDILEQTLSTLRGLAAPGGVVILTTPNDEDLARWQAFCPSCERVFHRWQHVRSWSADTLPRYLASRGFSATRTLTTDLSVSFKTSPLRALKTWARRVVAPARREPHLVCICRPVLLAHAAS